MSFLRFTAILLLLQVLPLRSENLPFRDWRAVALMVNEETNDLATNGSPLRISGNNPKSKKLIAALLAFPFPCGIVGLHRIYLGCSPHVPVVYIATVGGGFGLLPLIDFILLLRSGSLEPYINNGRVFMWSD